METPLNDADAVVAQIRGAFSNIPHVARKSLVYEGSWETEDLLQNLAKVQDTPMPNLPTRQIEQASGFVGDGGFHLWLITPEW